MQSPRGGVRITVMDSLKEKVKQILTGYAGEALNGYSYLTTNPDESMFTVVGVGKANGRHFATLGLAVRVTNDQIVIDQDVNDKPLVDALVQSGIPRKQIVLAYAGESGTESN